MVPYFRAAADLLNRAVLPAYGDVSSYGSFSPPGTAWLMAPGMLLFDDPRLYEKLGSAALHVGTLVGVYLLARETLGKPTAFIAVLAYGLSTLGLSFAGSLWPIGHPFFYVWATYLAARWVLSNRPIYLAAGLATCAVGLYQDIAIAPAVLVFPVAWVAYRPSVWSPALLAAALVAVVAWYPYLAFEADRGFADVRSLILRSNIAPTDYRSAWCDPGLALTASGDPAAPADTRSIDPLGGEGRADPPVTSIPGGLLAKLNAVPNGLLATFNEATRLPGAAVVLLLLLAVSVLAVAIRLRRAGAPLVPSQAENASRQLDQAERVERRRLGMALIALAVPWLVLIALAEPDRPERFFWIWPLQAIWIAAFFGSVLPSGSRSWPSSLSRSVVLAGSIALVALLALGPLQAHARAWSEEGWAGSDPDEVRLVDHVARDILASGERDAVIGYQTFIFDFMPKYHIIDPDYKVGAELDLLFEHGYGITNLNQCAEGVSPEDEYRIVQTQPRSGIDEPRQSFDVPLDGQYRLIARFELFDVFKRI